MGKRRKTVSAAVAIVLILSLTAALSGCGNSAVQNARNTEGTMPSSAEPAASSETADSDAAVSAEASDGENERFTARDLSQSADLSEAISVSVSDGGTITINEAGVYVLSGDAENATVVVDAGDDDKVQLVLDGLTIVNAHQACIRIENADKVFLTSAEGSENSLAVTGAFTGDEDAVVFSRDDLVLNGLGTVAVSSTGDGIRTNDDLKLTGGTWAVTASDCAMKAHNGIYVCDGVYELTAGSDGLHAEDNDDDTIGIIVIDGGSFTVQAGDDGIHATTTMTVNEGTLAIRAAEGIEATQVTVNGGTVSIQATDDGINAGQKSSALSIKIEINGGEISIAMGAGDTDAVDSNGDLIITGGTLDITAQSAFDYDGSCRYTGGTIIVNGVETNSVSNQMMGGGMAGIAPGGFGGRR